MQTKSKLMRTYISLDQDFICFEFNVTQSNYNVVLSTMYSCYKILTQSSFLLSVKLASAMISVHRVLYCNIDMYNGIYVSLYRVFLY